MYILILYLTQSSPQNHHGTILQIFTQGIIANKYMLFLFEDLPDAKVREAALLQLTDATLVGTQLGRFYSLLFLGNATVQDITDSAVPQQCL